MKRRPFPTLTLKNSINNSCHTSSAFSISCGPQTTKPHTDLCKENIISPRISEQRYQTIMHEIETIENKITEVKCMLENSRHPMKVDETVEIEFSLADYFKLKAAQNEEFKMRKFVRISEDLFC